MNTTTLGTVTEQALRGTHLATTFETAVKRVFASFTVEMTRPETSTHDGARARQPIRLIAADGAALVIGWANAADGRAELRTLGHTLALSKQRYGREMVLPPLEYLRFLEIATKVLEDHGLAVEVVAFTRGFAQNDIENASARPAPRRAMTLPYYVTGAVSSVGALARRVLA